jgi:outer membrane protein TolC
MHVSQAENNHVLFFFKEAYKASPKIEYTKTILKVKEAQLKQVSSEEGIKISATSYLGRERYESTFYKTRYTNLKYYNINISKPIFIPGFQYKLKEAKLDIAEAKVDIKRAKATLYNQVAFTLWELAINKEKEKLLHEIIDLLDNKVENLHILLKRRKIPANLLLETQQKKDLFIKQLKEVEVIINQSLLQLNILCNKQYSKPPVYFLTQKDMHLFLDFIPKLSKIAINIDVERTDKRIQKYRARLEYQKYMRYPHVSFNTYYAYTSSSAISTASKDLRAYIVFNFPIYQGGLIRAYRYETRETIKALNYKKQDLLKEIQQRKLINISSLKGSFDKLQVLKSQANLINDLIRLKAKQMEAGKLSKLSLIDSQLDLKRTYLEILSVKEEIGITYLKLLSILDIENLTYFKPIISFLSTRATKATEENDGNTSVPR